jgi:hypothetical protein
MGQLKFAAVNILFDITCHACRHTSDLIRVLHKMCVLLQANRTPALVHTLISRTADPEVKEEVSAETDQISA